MRTVPEQSLHKRVPLRRWLKRSLVRLVLLRGGILYKACAFYIYIYEVQYFFLSVCFLEASQTGLYAALTTMLPDHMW